MTLDVGKAKQRLKIMAVIDGIAVVIAMAAAVGAFGYRITWLNAVFVAALAVGFGAQIWFIAGLRRADKGV